MCMYVHVSVGIVSVSACCLSFLQGITAPFPEACMATRRRATNGACAIGVASPAQAAPCTTSTRGPWFGPRTTLLSPFEK